MRLLQGEVNLDISKAIENKVSSNSNDRYIEGYMTTPIVDLENEIADPSAYPEAVEDINRRAKEGNPIPIFIEHRRKEISLPIGQVISAKATPTGIWFKGKLATGKIADPVWELIEQGILRGCSMGGDALETVPDFDPKSNREVRRIKKMIIRELSLTGLPVNPQAVFSIAKSLNIDSEEVAKKVNKLEKAIELEANIQTLEKAAKGTLDDDSVKRIKDALDNLENLLGIKSDISEDKGDKKPSEKEEPEIEVDEEMGTSDKLDTIISKLDEILEHERAEKDELKGGEEMEDKRVKKPIALREEDEIEESEELEDEDEEEDEAAKIRCSECDTAYDAGDVDYAVKFCPKCGSKLADEEEDEEEELDDEDFVEMCKFYDEDEDDEDEEDDEWDDDGEEDEDEEDEDEEEGNEDDDEEESFAKNLEILHQKQAESGHAIGQFKGNYIKPSTGKRTDPADTTMHEHPKPFKPLEGKVDLEPFKNYGKDRTEKSVKEAVKEAVQEALKPIQKVLDASTGRKSVIPSIEKSTIRTEPLTDADADRVFARALTMGMSDPLDGEV